MSLISPTALSFWQTIMADPEDTADHAPILADWLDENDYPKAAAFLRQPGAFLIRDGDLWFVHDKQPRLRDAKRLAEWIQGLVPGLCLGRPKNTPRGIQQPLIESLIETLEEDPEPIKQVLRA